MSYLLVYIIGNYAANCFTEVLKEMKNNLIKVAKEIKAKDGSKARTIYNYYLVFENGTMLPITIRLYDLERATGDKKEMLEKVNFSNIQLLSAFADLKDDEK